MTAGGKTEIAMLSPDAASDSRLVESVTSLINEVYAASEEGLWTDHASRTTVGEIARLTRAGQVATACAGARIVGCVRVQRLGSGIGEFGMLAVAPDYRRMGTGRDLVRFAELSGREMGCDTMQLEVLVPRGWSHPSKEFLTGWYTRIGYQPFRIGAVEESYPDLASLLATPCDFVIYRKDIAL